MATFTSFSVHLRVLDRVSKTKFSHFHLENVAVYDNPKDLKTFLLEQHSEKIRPADTTDFKIGCFIEGRGNKRYDIVDSSTLKQAYNSGKHGRFSLWVDPHVSVDGSQKGKRKKGKICIWDTRNYIVQLFNFTPFAFIQNSSV